VLKPASRTPVGAIIIGEVLAQAPHMPKGAPRAQVYAWMLGSGAAWCQPGRAWASLGGRAGGRRACSAGLF